MHGISVLWRLKTGDRIFHCARSQKTNPPLQWTLPLLLNVTDLRIKKKINLLLINHCLRSFVIATTSTWDIDGVCILLRQMLT